MGDFTDLSQFRVGELLVIPSRNIVVRDGTEILLEPRMMAVLVKLAENAGQTLSTVRFLREIWGGEFYGDNPVNKTMSILRKLLGDDAHAPRYIETVRKLGYRLIAPVSFPSKYRSKPLPSKPWKYGNPYVGLAAFDEKHADVFCGRGGMIDRLLVAMRNQIENHRRFVILVGASGSGKTSLLRAGVIPLLTRDNGFDGMQALSSATCDLSAAPDGDPMSALAASLATWSISGRSVFSSPTLDDLKKDLIERPGSIAASIEEGFLRCPKRSVAEQPLIHLILTIDHAEALVSIARRDKRALDDFMLVLHAICDSRRSLVTMVVRSDYYPGLIEALPDLADMKAGDGHIDVTPPRSPDITEMIRTPAARAGINFEIDGQGLDDVLRDATREQPDALPLLQHTLHALYESCKDTGVITFAAYQELGDLETAIANHAEAVYMSLDEGVRDTLDGVLKKLVLINVGSEDATACSPLLDKIFGEEHTLVEAFVSARLFVKKIDESGNPRFGVTHEALLRRWPRAEIWTKNNKRILQAKALLTQAANEWEKRGRNPDHLINPGQPLTDAIEVKNHHCAELSRSELDYIEASASSSRIKRRVRRISVIALILLTATSIAMTIDSRVSSGKAEARRLQTQDMHNFTITELAKKIEPTGNLEQLESISEKSISHYKNQPTSEMRAPDFLNYSRSLRILGRVRSAQGKFPEAKWLLAKSAEEAAKAIEVENENGDAWFELSQTIFYLGEIEFNSKNFEGADKKWMSYLAVSRKFTSSHQNDTKWLMEESFALNSLGSSSLRQNNPDIALNYFRASEKIKRRIFKLDENNLEHRFEWIDSRSWIGSALQAKGSLRIAAQSYDSAIQDLRNLIGKKKNSNTWKLRLANYLMLSAQIENSIGNNEKAMKSAAESVRIMEKLNSIEPENKEWEDDLNSSILIMNGMINYQNK